MKKNIKLALLHNLIRGDEKLLIDAAKKFDLDLVVVDVTKIVLSPEKKFTFDVVLERCVSTIKGMHAVEFFESIGIPAVNRLQVASICENKFATSLALAKGKIPTPDFALVFSEIEAKKAISEMGGYPVVLKSVSGSWGRLIAKIGSEDALEAVIEQKMILGGPHHHSFYIQKYIDKPGRDIRIHVIGGEVIAAIYRRSHHWITNTARGAEALPCPIDKDLKAIAEKTGMVIGDGVLGIDIFETSSGYVVNEVNHTMEFKNVQRVTGIDVASEIIKYCLEKTL